ncbi:MAG TPA: SPW repeat protein [Candidatus Tyrphobacter sp.]|nr:SPW repeat protein [Candidatus Tyrphobacter sp.]
MAWRNWIILAAGLWVAISPWFINSLGINGVWSNLVAGAVVVIAALWNFGGGAE